MDSEKLEGLLSKWNMYIDCTLLSPLWSLCVCGIFNSRCTVFDNHAHSSLHFPVIVPGWLVTTIYRRALNEYKAITGSSHLFVKNGLCSMFCHILYLFAFYFEYLKSHSSGIFSICFLTDGTDSILWTCPVHKIFTTSSPLLIVQLSCS